MTVENKAQMYDIPNTSKHNQRSYRNVLNQFKKITSSFANFKLFFLGFLAIEIIFFMICISNYVETTMLAVILGGILLTCSTYFILLFYFQAKKPEQLLLLKEKFIDSSRRTISLPKGEVEHHLSVSQVILKLVSYLNDYEYNYFLSLQKIKILSGFFRKLSSFFHYGDVVYFKEMLIHASICEHIEQIRYTPTDLEVHASLANSYVILARFYLEIIEAKILKKFVIAKMKKKFDTASSRSIEELKILNDYAPNDPWVHSQLAQSYSYLQMKEDQIREYETILQLSPNDYEVLYQLGILYFEINHNSKGLRVYEELKKVSSKKAENLLKYYGTSQSIELLQETL